MSGGYFNTYKITGLGTHGGVEVRDFSTLFGDVLCDVIGAGTVKLVGSAGDLVVSVV